MRRGRERTLSTHGPFSRLCTSCRGYSSQGVCALRARSMPRRGMCKVCYFFFFPSPLHTPPGLVVEPLLRSTLSSRFVTLRISICAGSIGTGLHKEGQNVQERNEKEIHIVERETGKILRFFFCSSSRVDALAGM